MVRQVLVLSVGKATTRRGERERFEGIGTGGGRTGVWSGREVDLSGGKRTNTLSFEC